MLKKIAALCLAFLLGLAIPARLTLAQPSTYLESRLSRLESEISVLRSQVTQLASQTNQSRPGNLQLTPPASRTPSRQARQPVVTDPMFSRLATLVIELKERVNRLEAQVADLKRRVMR